MTGIDRSFVKEFPPLTVEHAPLPRRAVIEDVHDLASMVEQTTRTTVLETLGCLSIGEQA